MQFCLNTLYLLFCHYLFETFKQHDFWYNILAITCAKAFEGIKSCSKVKKGRVASIQ